MKRRQRQRALSEKDKKGLAIIAMAGATVLILITIPLLLGSETRYEPDTLCPIDQAYPRIVVIVDKTDPLTRFQSNFVRTEIERLRDGMEQYTKLTIYVLDQRNFATPKPVFELCNPGTGKEASALYQNPTKIRLRYQKEFGLPLENQLVKMTEGTAADRSPIMEMIRNVVHNGDFDDSRVKRRLILVSDMLQHMPKYSHYRNPADFAKFAKSDYFKRVRVEMPGVEVDIVFLLRRGREKLQSSRHTVFWERYFKSGGATLINVRYGP